jgi:hypothetical protein
LEVGIPGLILEVVASERVSSSEWISSVSLVERVILSLLGMGILSLLGTGILSLLRTGILLRAGFLLGMDSLLGMGILSLSVIFSLEWKS